MDNNSSMIQTIIAIISGAGSILLIDIIRNTYKNKNKNKNKNTFNGEERREGMQAFATAIASLEKQIADLKTDVKKDVDTLSVRVDKWADKLLEFYAKKELVDKVDDKVQVLNREMGEVKYDGKMLKDQVSELMRRFNDLSLRNQ